MENPQPQNPQPAQPAPPAQPQVAPQTPAAPAMAQQQPVAQTPATQPVQSQPATPAPASAVKVATTTLKTAAGAAVDQTKSNKRLVVGCIGAFGCSLFLFIGVLFAFLMFGSTENPIFGFLGVPKTDVVNVLIDLINLIFLVLVFISFIFVIIGVFKISTARKDDKEARRKGSIFTFISMTALIVLIFLWGIAYVFLSQKRTVTQRIAIATTPEITTNLTAPVQVKFDATKAQLAANLTALSYTWNFDDGSDPVSGKIQSHTFTKVGNYKVNLTIAVKDKATGKEDKREFSKDVTVQNVLAEIIIKADKKKGEAPLTVNLDGSESNSPNGEITAYAWDLDGDQEFDDGTEKIATATFDKIGTYAVSLRVTDSTGTFASDSIEIEVIPSKAPTAVITVEDIEGTELELNKAYIFSAANSGVPEGTIEKYDWTFGDGGKATTKTATHTFKDAGDYDVTLTVTSSIKEKGSATQRYTVKAPLGSPIPFIKTTPEAKDNIVTVQAPFDLIFDASGSKDPNNNIVEYAWDFNGDNKTDDANATTSYKFTTAGTYNVTLTVTDSSNLSAKTQIVVKVEAPGLKAEVTADPISGVVPLTVSFDASGSSYPTGKIVSYEWNFGDGTDPRIDAAKVSHQFTAIGTFTTKVTAITNDNKKAPAQVMINVRSVPVKACFEPNVSSGKAPFEVQFNPSCSTGTIVKYSWNFSGLGKSASYKPSYTFNEAGEYSVSLEVTDNQNNVDKFTKTIKVLP
ncbi:PKD domain-containing protein [Candidatus Peregrinibacteria bacterium]|nr:PKD domain-containing protein [Candidatus Peregrinibacteria bacterium]